MNLQPVAPSLTFVSPPYGYTCTALVRTSRGAITYTDFETYPLSGWQNNGGTNFQLVTGHKGSALQYSDNNGGIGSASQYYYNTRLDTTYSSLWVAVKVYGSPTTTYKGLALINAGLNRLYEISIYSSSIYVWSYNVESAGGWRQLGSATISNFNSGYWYTIVLNYTVTSTAVNFYVWVYDPYGNQVAYLTASSTSGNRFRPAYIGLEVDYTGFIGTGYSIFDDFIISTTDPRTVTFSNLQSGLVFNIYDNLGTLTYSFTATSSTYSLNVVRDVVLGTGSDGNIRISYPGGSFLCLNVSIPTSDAFLGGDKYSLITYTLSTSIDPTGTNAVVTAYVSSGSNALTSFYAVNLTATQNYYLMLELDVGSSTIDSSLNAEIYVEGNSQKITIVNGAPTSTSTDWVFLPSSSTKHVIVGNAYASSESTSTLVLKVIGCVGGPNYVGACVIYPLTIQLIDPDPTLSYAEPQPATNPSKTSYEPYSWPEALGDESGYFDEVVSTQLLLNYDFNESLSHWEVVNGTYLKWVSSTDPQALGGVALLNGTLPKGINGDTALIQQVFTAPRIVGDLKLEVRCRYEAQPKGQLSSQSLTISIIDLGNGNIVWSTSLTPTSYYNVYSYAIPSDLLEFGNEYLVLIQVNVSSKGNTDLDYRLYLDYVLLEEGD
ncbi:hypothetical protein Igag_1321 [Ignisphaera aggregans DSM 17230]|uniref:Uncharacterized protein n=1 Tax=Ignisphaera aggregans (strain DSM 17230 / JCM 13409 / AQ1.S1) TaxID=583356 RepID=E0SPR9_IGNAA|nr:hypothetical protein Igag_1321 [Ignisphaera aggregans DSM 17230]